MKYSSDTTEAINTWSLDHFVALILLYASHADYDYSTEEKEHILEHTSDTILAEVEKVFYGLGDYQQLDLIIKLKKKWVTSDDERDKLFGLLKRHFDADGDFSRLENSTLAFLNRLL
jgi:hypothetical protein